MKTATTGSPASPPTFATRTRAPRPPRSPMRHAVLDAGRALIEAKSLVRHGRWLPWLKEHCHLPERTAQLYMQLAERELPPAIIARLGMTRAAQTQAPTVIRAPDRLAGYSEAVQREWLIFVAFTGSRDHVAWCMRQGWSSPDAWLADAAYRRRNRMREPTEAFMQAWMAFKLRQAEKPRAAIEAELDLADAA